MAKRSAESNRKMIETRRRNASLKANGGGELPLDLTEERRPKGRSAPKKLRDPAIILLDVVIALLEQRK